MWELNGGRFWGHKPGFWWAGCAGKVIDVLGSRKTVLTFELGHERLDLETDCDVNSFLLLVAG